MKPLTRRGFGAALARGAVRLAGIGAVLHVLGIPFRSGKAATTPELRETGVLRPPGALPEEDFLARCIRCELCADACDTGCIRLLPPGSGRSTGTPVIFPWDRACNLCMACTEVCPSGALKPGLDKHEVRMGDAVVDERLCVSHNGTGACGACHTACPFRGRALTQGIRNAPTVHPDSCVGCGLCEEVCIVEDRRAIRVFSGRAWT